MNIYDRQGKILYTAKFGTLRRTLEEAARERVSLRHADLRRAYLAGATLEDVDLTGACLWGADLSKTNMAGSILNAADLRMTVLKETCLAEARMIKADLRGAYFAQALLAGADLSLAHISCPSFFNQSLTHVTMNGLSYWHRGEDHLVLDRPPIVISGLAARIVLFPGGYIIGDTFYMSPRPTPSAPTVSQNNNMSIPKIWPLSPAC